MGLAYYSNNDAHSKLHRTIIMYDGKPYYCQDSGNGIHFMLWGLREDPNNVTLDKIDMTVPYTDPKFDYLDIKIGYINNERNCAYLTRNPTRKIRQALGLDDINWGNISSRTFYSKRMEECILGQHMTAQEALDSVLRSQRDGAAFHREFAVVRDGSSVQLHHRGDVVGYKTNRKNYDLRFNLVDVGYGALLQKRLSPMGVEVC